MTDDTGSRNAVIRQPAWLNAGITLWPNVHADALASNRSAMSVIAVLGLSGPIGYRQTSAQFDEIAVGRYPRVPLVAAYVVSDLGAQCLWGRGRNRPDPNRVIHAA